jgi:hypothetical protein
LRIFANVIGGKFLLIRAAPYAAIYATRVGLGVGCDLAHSAEVDVDAFLIASLLAAVGTLPPKKQLKHSALLTTYDPTDRRLTCAGPQSCVWPYDTGTNLHIHQVGCAGNR